MILLREHGATLNIQELFIFILAFIIYYITLISQPNMIFKKIKHRAKMTMTMTICLFDHN